MSSLGLSLALVLITGVATSFANSKHGVDANDATGAEGSDTALHGWQEIHEFVIPVVIYGHTDGAVAFNLYIDGTVTDDERYAIKDAIYLGITRFVCSNHRVLYVSGRTTYKYDGVACLTNAKVTKLVTNILSKIGVSRNLRVINFRCTVGR